MNKQHDQFQFQLLFRKGIERLNPEGDSWEEVALPGEFTEALNVSVGPLGLTWVVTWSGNVFVRLGVDSHNVTGEALK